MEPRTYKKRDNRIALLEAMPEEEFVLEFCEGNPGCAGVVGKIAEYISEGRAPPLQSPMPLLVQLVDMNIRGAQLYVLFTGVFHGNVAQMIPAIMQRDKVMIDRLNAIMYHPLGEKPKIPYHQLAVETGWKP